MAEQARAKSLARELAGLPPMHEEGELRQKFLDILIIRV